MKQEMKEMIFSYLILFTIGGMLGFIYGLLSGNYCYAEGVMVFKLALINFLEGGIIFVTFLAGISIIVVILRVIFTWSKS